MNSLKRGSLVWGPVFLCPNPKFHILAGLIKYLDQSVGTVSLKFKHLPIKCVEMGASQYQALGLPRLALDTTCLSKFTDSRIIRSCKIREKSIRLMAV